MTTSARRCTIEGRGIDGRGASRALASGVVTASGGGAATVLKVEGNFNVTGPLETFANAGGVHLARAILAEFAGNMAKLAPERPAPCPNRSGAGALPLTLPATRIAHPQQRASGGEGPATAGSSAAPLHGGALLWRAFLGWLKQLFSVKGKTG